jgi:hypothetical protein
VQNFFSSQWQLLARQAALNFFSTVLPQTPLPAILQLQSERCLVHRSLADMAALKQENAQLRAQLRQANTGDGQGQYCRGASVSGGGRGEGEEGVELVDMAPTQEAQLEDDCPVSSCVGDLRPC